MAEYTKNLQLKKPSYDDFADVADLNGNMDLIDAAVAARPAIGADGKLQTTVIPELSYIKTNARGNAGGVASLDSSKKIPVSQLPKIDILLPRLTVNGLAGINVTASYVGESTGMALNWLALENPGKTPVFDLPYYGRWTISATVGNFNYKADVDVTDVREYTVDVNSSSPDGAVLSVSALSGAAVYALCGDAIYTAVAGSTGAASLKLPAVTGEIEVYAALNGKVSAHTRLSIDGAGNYSAECPFFDSVLANNSWAQIAKASSLGLASSLWKLGDEKGVTVGSDALTFTIIGFDHDFADGGKPCGITFALKSLIDGPGKMNDTATNVGGYTASKFCAWLETYYDSLPDELKNYIKDTYKYTSVGGASQKLELNAFKLFAFSESEVDKSHLSCAGEGAQYEYFKDTAHRIKAKAGGGATYWWLRSPAKNDSTSFCTVTYSGSTAATYEANIDSYGFCFGFCV